ncbi:MAG: FAD-binding protein [Chloroflexota bacterium]|nr:FAD-binding protein [Chloroflexota bacterium]
MVNQTQRAVVDGAQFDVVIVGAGVAGLLAAHELLRRRPGTRMLVADAGPPLEGRSTHVGAAMGGFGGAGLFLGGRLYLGAAALPVQPPVTAPEALRPVVSGEEYVRQANIVDALLHDLGARAEWQRRPPEPLEQAIAQAEAAGLEYVTSYPSRRLSPEDKRTTLAALRERLEAGGARFLFQAQVRAVEGTGAGFTLALASADGAIADVPRKLRARMLLLAPGRYGAEWLKQIAEALGAEVVATPSLFGVRLEIPASVYDPLTDVNPDPRLQMALASDAYIKTYATCPGGRVVAVARYGALVASGVPALRREERGPSTTLAILAQPGVVGARGEWRGGEACAATLNARAPGRLIAQRLGDVRRGEATSEAALAANPVRPTDGGAVAGGLHDAFPSVYWRAFETFLARIERLAPGVASDDALVYGPAEERAWRYPTDATLQTTTRGLFVAGDGAGQSQGIIQASVAGLLAGEGIARALDAATPARGE